MSELLDFRDADPRAAREAEEPPAGDDHPIQILRREHELLLRLTAELEQSTQGLAACHGPTASAAAMTQLATVVTRLREAQTHYLREENVLFPYLEKHGVVGPPTVMWSEHDAIRGMEKAILALVDGSGGGSVERRAVQLREQAESLASMLAAHYYKENNILFLAAEELFTEAEWTEVARGFGEIGYWQVVPRGAGRSPEATVATAAIGSGDGLVTFETGAVSREVLEAMLNTMPVDFTFVDASDTVQYFSQGKDRVFPRTTAILGRKVQQCHPEKSFHVVNQILEDFRNGVRGSAEFWIQSGGHFLTIRYFPVRDRAGAYLGCLEVTQDATDLRALEGEKRLL